MKFELTSFGGNYSEEDIGRMGIDNPRKFDEVVGYLKKCQTLLENEELSAVQKRFVFFCMMDALNLMLGRGVNEALIQETRNRIQRMGSNIPEFNTKQGRGASDVIKYIENSVDPLLDPDMKNYSKDLSVWSWANPRAGTGQRKSIYQTLLNKNSRNRLEKIAPTDLIDPTK